MVYKLSIEFYSVHEFVLYLEGILTSTGG